MITEEKGLMMLAGANPVPQLDQVDIDVEAAMYLATLTTRSSDMTELGTKTPERKDKKRSLMPWLIAAGVAAVIGVGAVIASQSAEEAPVADQPTLTAGPVTIKTNIDRTLSPLSGTFRVTVGADLLGCSSGTVVFMDSEKFGWDDSVMTCDSGPNTGTFTIIQGGGVSRWSVLESSEDFAGLQGEGMISFVLGATTVAETFTGDIEYTP